jgi:hypothetical protein
MTTEKPISPYLLGAGIVRGLSVTRQPDQNIVLESGFGYGSDGLPFFCDTTIYRHYKQLHPMTGERDDDLVAILEYFRTRLKTTVTDLPIWELKTDAEWKRINDKHALRLLKPQNASDTEGSFFLEDKVVLLFRSSREARVRVLLMPRTLVAAFTFSSNFKWQEVVENDNEGAQPFSIWGEKAAADPSQAVTDHDVYVHLNPALQLPVLGIRRFGYGDLQLEDFACDALYMAAFCRTGDVKGVLSNFDSVCKEYASIIDKIKGEMEHALTDFHRHFGGIIGSYAVSILNKWWQNFEARWCTFREISTATDKTAMQYWYDAFADLTTAFNELRAEALRFHAANDLNPTTFPQHLLLGSLAAEPIFTFPNPFRTDFQQAPIFNGQAEQLQRLRFLHWRLVIMMKCFYAPNSDMDDLASDSVLSPSDEVNADNAADITVQINMPIRLTPSRHLSLPLGQRAIPYYYDLSRSEQSLHWFWDFEATQQNRATEHLSYHSENEAAFVKLKGKDFYAGTEGSRYSQVQHIVHPFAFDLRAFPFVRIEGLMGKTGMIVEAAAEKLRDFRIKDPSSPITGKSGREFLNALAKQYNICFDVEFVELKKGTSLQSVMCGKCFEHLGGVYHGGTFVIFYEDVTVSRGVQTYKIVADFTYVKKAVTIGNSIGTLADKSDATTVAEPPVDKGIIAEKAIKKSTKK